MVSQNRAVIDLRSQDLEISDLESFRKAMTGSGAGGEKSPEELIMFSSSNKPYQFDSLSKFEKNMGKIPDNASYFYYTLTFSSGDRASLYLDPDRPGKVVLEGSNTWLKRGSETISSLFPKGGERYKIHQRYGIILIWSMIIILAAVVLAVSSLIVEITPVVISVVIFTSSMLGIYLSVVRSKELQPANTISFVKRRRFWVETVLHFLTIVLGIISAVLASVIVTWIL
jgi:hypothetical protein